MKARLLFFPIGAILLAAQSSAPAPAPATAPASPAATSPATPAPASSSAPTAGGRERYDYAVTWVQTSGEWRALFYQGFNLARMRLDQQLALKRDKPPAIITDVDDTVLDTTAYYAQVVLLPFDKVIPWTEWLNRAECVPTPGSLEFLRYAASKNVEVFYVTNRIARERAGTLANLKKLNFPFADEEHVITRTAEANKENRRRAIAQKFDILLLLGDNLGDLAEFNEKPSADRRAQADQQHDDFGQRFIIFPNPLYGDWEGSLYLGRRNPTDADKQAIRHEALKPYR